MMEGRVSFRASGLGIYLIGSHMIPCRVGQVLPANRFLLLVVVLSAYGLSLFAPECSVLHKTLGIIQANRLFPAFFPEHSRCQPYRIRVRQRIVLMRSTGNNYL